MKPATIRRRIFDDSRRRRRRRAHLAPTSLGSRQPAATCAPAPPRLPPPFRLRTRTRRRGTESRIGDDGRRLAGTRVQFNSQSCPPMCGIFEVKFPGIRLSRYFYWRDLPSRRLRPEILTHELRTGTRRLFVDMLRGHLPKSPEHRLTDPRKSIGSENSAAAFLYWPAVSAARTASAMGLCENQRANARVSAGAPSNCTCPACNTSDHAHRPSQTR